MHEDGAGDLLAAELVECAPQAARKDKRDRLPLPLPQVTTFGGPIMVRPQLVPIFFSGDPYVTR